MFSSQRHRINEPLIPAFFLLFLFFGLFLFSTLFFSAFGYLAFQDFYGSNYCNFYPFLILQNTP
jgi:hypothetical protein